MLKRWKRRAKLLAMSIVIAGYVTVGVFNASLREKGEEPGEDAGESTTVKTIVGYSMEFRMREETMTEEISCRNGGGETLPEEGASSWQRDDNLRMSIFSAYYDARLQPYHYVRVIGLLPRNASLYCQIWYGDEEEKEKDIFIIRKAVVREIWSANWGREEGSCEKAYPSLISCPTPVREDRQRPPVRVSFVDKSCNRSNVSITVNTPQTKPLSFVVCTKALNYTGHANDVSLTEWIELNSILGAGKIVVYVSHLSGVDMTILRRYEEKAVVEVREFEPLTCPLATYEDTLWQKRKMEVIAYNDCFYRNIHGAKFVIPLDIDEVIVPKKGRTWEEAFREHFGGDGGQWPSAVDDYSSLSVRNVYFFARYPPIPRHPLLNASQYSNLVTALEKQNRLAPGDSIFRRTVRSSEFSPQSDSAKSFLHVQKTLSVFNHYAFHVLGDAARQYVFPESVLQLNHYRTTCDPVLIDGCHQFLSRLTVDDSLDRFRRQIPLLNRNI